MSIVKINEIQKIKERVVQAKIRTILKTLNQVISNIGRLFAIQITSHHMTKRLPRMTKRCNTKQKLDQIYTTQTRYINQTHTIAGVID